MAVALIDHRPEVRGWPITGRAHRALEADVARIGREVLSTNGYVTGRLEGEPDAPSFVPNIVGQQALRQLINVRAVLENAQLVNEAGLAVIGREVTLRDAGWDTSRYLLVIPGEGNAAAGSVSVDSPVGMALLGRRVGEVVTISAPAGPWTATIVAIE